MSLEQWESYYKGGALATGPTGPDGTYDQELRRAWVEFYSTLPDQARILDIGTGNGVLPLIARQVASSRGASWELHGSDLAQIDPPRYVPDGERRFAGVHFHPGVATEKLPFDDASFDAVTGHYALEYSDVAAALAQIHRVLKPGSDAQFIVHSTQSALVSSARWSLQEADIVLKQTRLYRKLHRLVTMEGATSASTQRATNELVSAIRAVKQVLPQARQVGTGRILSVALDAVQKLLTARKQMRPQAVGLEVDRAEKELRASARRLNDLVSHARSEQDMALVQQQASAAGFTQVECLPQFHAGTVPVGWQLLLHRP